MLPINIKKQPAIAHPEEHFMASELVRDIIIGVSDGLTVPFALAAGLASAGSSSSIVIAVGLAEIAAGSISMSLGGYLAAKSVADHYDKELQREQLEVETKPEAETGEISEIFQSYGLSEQESAPVVNSLKQRKKSWIDFMMRFELGLEKPNRRRAFISAITVGASYIIGGLVPLAPYFFISGITQAFKASVAITLLALIIFGFLKGNFTTTKPVRSTLETVVIGGLAAIAAFILAKLFS